MTSLANDINLPPQARTVLLHLEKHASISPMEALVTYGFTRLASPIHHLRKAGYDIQTTHNRDAAGKPYGRYWLMSALQNDTLAA